MFKQLRLVVSSICLLALASAGQAETDAKTAEALMRKSGIWQQLEAFAPQVREGFNASAAQAKLRLSASETSRVTDVVDEVFAAERLRMASLAVIARDLDEQRLPALGRWYASAPGVRITKCEEAASADTSPPEAQVRKGMSLLASMPRERRAVLLEVVKATGAAEVMTSMVIESGIAAAEGLASVTPRASTTPLSDLRQSFENQRPAMLGVMADMALGGFARAYASLSIDDLRKYARFLNSDAGRHYNELGNRALIGVLRDSITEFGRRLPGTKDQSNT